MLPRLKCASKKSGLQADRALVERLRFRQFVAAVVDVGEVDEGRHEIRIVLERLAVRRRSLLARRVVAVIERGRRSEEVLGDGGFANGGRRGPGRRRRRGRLAPQRDDLRGRGVEAEVERQLPLPRGNHRPDDGPEGSPALQFLVDFLERGKVGNPKNVSAFVRWMA